MLLILDVIAPDGTSLDAITKVLNNFEPAKFPMLRVEDGKGAAIEVEVWALSAEGFGRFVDGIPSPLSIGTVKLSDGRGVKGFLLEAAASHDARDISSFGGWRKFLASKS